MLRKSREFARFRAFSGQRFDMFSLVSPCDRAASVALPGHGSLVQEDHTLAMNRSELVAAVAAKTENSQVAVNGVLSALFEGYADQISQGAKGTIPGWLAAGRTDRAARTGRNPQTGEAIQIPAGHSVKLTAGSKLKAAVSKK